MTLLLFLAILSILVFVHEMGHFIVAKRSGIRVEEFGFGLPPRVFGKKIGGTIYSFNLLPIGGFVRLFGEDGDDVRGGKAPDTQTLRHAFYSQPKRVRIAVVVAGVVMNFLLGVVLFGALYSFLGIPTLTDRIHIVGLSPESPAASVFQLGDEIISVSGEAITTTDQFKTLVDTRRGQTVTFSIVREGSSLELQTVPRTNPPVEEGSLGVVISPKIELVRYASWQMPFRGAWYGLGEAVAWGNDILKGLGGVFRELVSGTVPKDVGGPFEIYFLVSEVSKAGVVPLTQFMAVLSVNLAIVNLLPLPALDGGRLLFIGVEMVTGRRVRAKVEQMTHTIGMVFLLAVMLAITVRDVLRHFGAGSLTALLEKVGRM
ncbi:MAG: hypothetical protein A2900_04875 [Candidatus Chisholmbacteria bacterium RIFCSPLOWO2_01_FULL_50_28]|uniref:PDZ domain-containing protein n=1 Tax=Candidatus Chisholmbacteria bacterium RIFCSPHIGHO2_01_FULL_52_32 TaxID=1797591 RepID=A0A1G1VS55_9BACT|nr:MAG: hypothetical protein A2786_01865 [Candidatus Chisholmbacteria bacterium RIFCSPHIGHO2_01_FULL_52_32]OGY20381.1 MAG: hypothetical protein A2900_04875 [Candidatus Chisholmbacteria bacterium RIFCSPLOWO2_01_FULL_50_28]